MAGGMEFEEIAWLRANGPAWRLLRADSAPLVLSFLYRVFVAENVRSLPAAELASRLDDELYARNEQVPHSFPKPAKAYLDDWAAAEVDALAPDITLPMERPLYTPVREPRLDSDPVRPAGSGDETDPTALFEQVYVDPGPLRGNVRAALRRQPQVGLADLRLKTTARTAA